MDIFERYPNSTFLEKLRHPKCSIFSLPEKIKALYSHMAGQEDPHFESQLDCDPHARIWELMVAQIIHECGWEFQNTGTGPDFIISTSTRNICIEAICATDGKTDLPDSVPPLQNGVASLVPTRELLLRITSALATKAKKFSEDVKNGYARETDAKIIAISSSKMMRARAGYPSLGIKATLGVGDLFVIVNTMTEGIERTGYDHTPTVTRTNAPEISCTPFEDGLMDHISGVLYSEASIFSADYDLHRDSHFIHNHRAKVPLPAGTFAGVINEFNSKPR